MVDSSGVITSLKHWLFFLLNNYALLFPIRPLIDCFSKSVEATTILTQGDSSAFVIEAELGPGWQSRNDVQIPNDTSGSRFALDNISGDGPFLTARLNFLWNINDKHGLRVLLAPLSFEEKSVINADMDFAGTSFQQGQAAEAKYKFNSWRLSYRYHMLENERWDLWLGGTLKVRDAEVRLSQDGVSANDDDVGFVPLFYLASTYRLNEKWSFKTELDALAGGPGRAIDLGLRLDYRINPNWSAGAGYRTLEGGADTDDVYNFAWFNSFVFSTAYRF